MRAIKNATYQCAVCGECLDWQPNELHAVLTTSVAMLRHPYRGSLGWDDAAQTCPPCPHRDKVFAVPVELVELTDAPNDAGVTPTPGG
jgi:hypothetical protein